jgi:hypothetical protein
VSIRYPVAKGLIVGHEPVGVIAKLGAAVTGFKEGQRVIAGAITPFAAWLGDHNGAADKSAGARRQRLSYSGFAVPLLPDRYTSLDPGRQIERFGAPPPLTIHWNASDCQLAQRQGISSRAD